MGFLREGFLNIELLESQGTFVFSKTRPKPPSYIDNMYDDTRYVLTFHESTISFDHLAMLCLPLPSHEH